MTGRAHGWGWHQRRSATSGSYDGIHSKGGCKWVVYRDPREGLWIESIAHVVHVKPDVRVDALVLLNQQEWWGKGLAKVGRSEYGHTPSTSIQLDGRLEMSAL